jgi:dienelactone hydrolase
VGQTTIDASLPEKAMTIRSKLLAVAAAVTLDGVLATPVHAQIARTEVLTFASMTLTDQEFLTGRKDGRPVTLAGVLRLPGSQGKVPAAILLHGSGGISSYVTDWESDFNALGMATFVVDSFSGRGIANTNADQFVLGRLAMIVDAYRALEVIARHPRVDPSRIVLMGFSRGGQAALYASVDRFQRMHMPDGVSFAAYVPLYPACNTTYRGDEGLVDRPVRMFHGTDDDYNPVAPCRAYVERLKARGRDVQLTEYAGAGHVFDGKAFRTPLVVKTWQTFRNCALAEADGGAVINARTAQVFASGDACIELGPTVAYNERAAGEVRAAVTDFMRATVLKK